MQGHAVSYCSRPAVHAGPARLRNSAGYIAAAAAAAAHRPGKVPALLQVSNTLMTFVTLLVILRLCRYHCSWDCGKGMQLPVVPSLLLARLGIGLPRVPWWHSRVTRLAAIHMHGHMAATCFL